MSTNGIFSRKRSGAAQPAPPPPTPQPVTAEALEEIFAGCADYESRPVWPGAKALGGVTVCWLDGLVSGKNVSEDVVRPLTDSDRLAGAESASECVERLLKGAVWWNSVKRRDSLDELAQDLVHGCCAVVFDHLKCAVSFETKTDDSRAISTPTIEKTVKGGKDAFVETLRTNTSLVRRKLRTPRLKLEQSTVGQNSGTDLAILYIEGAADADTLSELRARIDGIQIDGLTAAGQLEQRLTDHPYSPFPQLLHTERPDKFASELLVGRIGVIVDGLPVGFLMPATLSRFLSVAEDRAQHFLIASSLTLLRWLSLLISLLFPALFVAVSMYHQEMIPSRMLLSMIEAKQKVPFSEAFEVLAMLLAFELLLEAGIRLPDPIGDTVSIIGALIVGQSAVEASVVSPIAVIVVSTAAICGFTLPSRDMGAALRAGRVLMVFLAIALGLFGIALGLALLLWYLNMLESFGVAYTSPMAEGGFKAVLNSFIRLPGYQQRSGK